MECLKMVDTDVPVDVETECTFGNDDRLATLYTIYDSPTTSKAIVDAKAHYADMYDMDKRNVTARKFESGWDKLREEPYKVIAVAVSYEAQD